MMKQYEEMWQVLNVKVAFDSYRRPVCFVVPPQLLAATLVYWSDMLLAKLALFGRKSLELCQAERKELLDGASGDQ